MFGFFKKKSPEKVLTPVLLDEILPMVTTLAPEVAAAYDVEGEIWEFRRADNLIYMSGEDGLVQVQFRVEVLRDLLGELEQLTT